jgi:pimeloyl-ACP methyl ester carboxylesterase
VHQLGYNQASLVGHDIGLMVAYAYAAQYPAEVNKVVLMDAFLPGVGDWKSVWLMRDLWHFHWLSAEAGKEVVTPFPAQKMNAWAISPRVNSPRNNDPTILAPAE